MNPSDFYVDPFLHCPQKMWYINKIKPQPFAIGQIIAAFCWGTRTRTRKDRTRICSVANYTIPQTFFVSRFPLDYGCKFTGFFHIYQTKVHFFWKKSLLLQNIPAKCPILSIFHLKIIIHHGCSAILHDHHFETISSRDKSIKYANRHRKRNCGQFPEFS